MNDDAQKAPQRNSPRGQALQRNSPRGQALQHKDLRPSAALLSQAIEDPSPLTQAIQRVCKEEQAIQRDLKKEFRPSAASVHIQDSAASRMTAAPKQERRQERTSYDAKQLPAAQSEPQDDAPPSVEPFVLPDEVMKMRSHERAFVAFVALRYAGLEVSGKHWAHLIEEVAKTGALSSKHLTPRATFNKALKALEANIGNEPRRWYAALRTLRGWASLDGD